MTPTLPPRDSPLWKEAISAASIKPFLVRAMPRASGTLIDKIYGNSTFWIIPTVTETTDYTWIAVKTPTVVGWCASPPLVYTVVTPPPPPDDEDTKPMPPLPDAIYSAFLTSTELQQLAVLHTQIAALYRHALERGTTT